MGNKLIITKSNNQIISALFSEKELIDIHVDKTEEDSLLGNIYLGKIKNIIKNINAAFVEIDNGTMCYLSLSEDNHPVCADNKGSKALKIGDELIVQIVKEGIKTKAPVVTTDFSLTGKYVVLVHGKAMLGISSKISEKDERKRLKAIVSPYVRDSYGFIIRTNAENTEEELIEEELHKLYEAYMRLLTFGVHWNCFSLLYRTPATFIWKIRDDFSKDLQEIKTDDVEVYNQIKSYMETNQKEDIDKLVLYTDDTIKLSKLYNLDAKLEQLTKECVWLASGAYLVIQPTEALTVIDVNTGKAISGKKQAEETFYQVNIEAAEEIARQIRLRNLSGIIIVDFIDMTDQVHRNDLMKNLEILFEADPVKTNVIDMTALNLVEITRKKVRKPLHEVI